MTWCLHTHSHQAFYIFINNSRFKQNKNNHGQPFVDIFNQETRAQFQQKILNFMVVGARQSFQFFRQIAWFLEEKEVEK